MLALISYLCYCLSVIRQASSSSTSAAYQTTVVTPSGTQNPVRWNGWGFKDTEFYYDGLSALGIKGHRYLYSGKMLPSVKPFLEVAAGLDINKTSPSQEQPAAPHAPTINKEFMQAIEGQYVRFDTSDEERLFHGHGHTCQEIYTLRFGNFKRIPDVVLYPGSHEHVEKIIGAANKYNVMVIPFGGGTSVSQALSCPVDEKRSIVSLDMHAMNKIRWINRKNHTACIEAGIVGKDLEQQLKGTGLVLGHEPDSMEFSTLGGWIATRASGMRKNKYGNIEDIIVSMKVVTSVGTLEKSCQVPRISTGPDVHEMILGSEGSLGVITEAVVRLRPAPQQTVYGSMIFPNFEQGVHCLYEIAIARCAPVSIRLVDNEQFQFGLSLKPPTEDWKVATFDKIKKWYVLNRLHFEPTKMVAATLLFEGTPAEIKLQEKTVYAIAAKYGGMKAGAENGVRGYFLTYMIAYLRDFGMNYQFIGESFETSCPHEMVIPLCANVKKCIAESAKKYGVQRSPFVSCRVTQLYDTGCAVYFYFGFVWHGLTDPVSVFDKIEHDAREEILKYGGSLSHHHGVGKLRKHWMEQTVSPVGMHALAGLKKQLDPKNIFGNQNLITTKTEESAASSHQH